ncbi:MAG: hypothetical protein ACOYNF_04990 [Rhodoferax sp.]|jgi:hypothetical protein
MGIHQSVDIDQMILDDEIVLTGANHPGENPNLWQQIVIENASWSAPCGSRTPAA